MAKYDVDRFETPPDEDLVCCICQCVLDNPLESPCRHVFCKVCIETWLTNRKNCPNCRKRLRKSKLKPVLPIVRNMINRLLIKCENREHGCNNGIKLEMYDRHVQNCDYAPIKCMNTGCGQTVLRMNMLVHEQNCKYRLVMCKKGCGLPISMEDSKHHNCLEELKRSMAAMEDQYQQRLRDLETQMNTKIQELEDRIKAMEEHCRRDYSPWSVRANSPSRDSFSSMAGFESDSVSRDNDYSNDREYDDNNDPDYDDNDDMGSNSFFYSGNSVDDSYNSTPEYTETQENDDNYNYMEYTPDLQSDQAQDGDDRDSDSAFFLNTDADSDNDSTGDLNDSLLDSSDAQSDGEVEDQDESDPVQVYEVSPTSPNDRTVENADNDAHREEYGGQVVSSSDNSNDDVVHVDTQPAPSQSPNHDVHSVQEQNARHETDSIYTAHGDSDAYAREFDGSGDDHHRDDYQGRESHHDTADPDSLDQVTDRRRSRSPQGRRSSRDRSQESHSSGDNHRGRSRRRRSARRRRSRRSSRSTSQSGDRRKSYNLRSSGPMPSSQEESIVIRDVEVRPRYLGGSSGDTDNQGQASDDGRGDIEYLYGIAIEESDSSTDPVWERTSLDHSSDVTISDEFSSDSLSSEGDSPDRARYKEFLTSLNSVPSSNSDKTWSPGGRRSSGDGWQSELDYEDDDFLDTWEEERRTSRQENDPSHSESQSRSRSLSRSPERNDAREARSSRSRERETSSRQGEQSASEKDPMPKSSDDVTTGSQRKRIIEATSSESENGEDDHHPAWKRRRHDDTKN